MLTELTVTNFRNLKDVSLENLGRITLIAGKNGVGKTALLEALWLLSGPDLPELSTRLNAFRGLPVTGPDVQFSTTSLGTSMPNDTLGLPHMGIGLS